MTIHELDDDGVALGGPRSVTGTTRCGAHGEVVADPDDGRRLVRTESGALFALSLLASANRGGLSDVHAWELEATTCRCCRRRAKR